LPRRWAFSVARRVFTGRLDDVIETVLMHGRAFGGYYFQNVIEALTAAGAAGHPRTRGRAGLGARG
jgi:hypothetical protein